MHNKAAEKKRNKFAQTRPGVEWRVYKAHAAVRLIGDTEIVRCVCVWILQQTGTCSGVQCILIVCVAHLDSRSD